MQERSPQSELDPAVREAVVAFLREWLPPSARKAYRELITHDPTNWSRDPHFAGGIIVDHALRGNGITEWALGVADLNAVWPDLLRQAVMEPDPTEEA